MINEVTKILKDNLNVLEDKYLYIIRGDNSVAACRECYVEEVVRNYLKEYDRVTIEKYQSLKRADETEI